MSESPIISLIDEEIERLEKVRALLGAANKSGSLSAAIVETPKTAKGTSAISAGRRRSKRKLSPEGRARIAEAQKKRWAAMKKK